MAAPPVRPPASSPLGRFLTLTGTAARIAGGVFGQRMLRGSAAIDWQPVGDLLGEVLGEMKGPVLKLGQMASQWQDLLPEPVRQALVGLQSQVPALPFAELEGHLRHLYDGDLDRHFRSIDPEPFAAASLGQVHRALTVDGRPLILKVQYPGIARICRADLAQLRRLLPLGRLLGVPGEQLEAVHRELTRSIEAELDYALELQRLKLYRRHFAAWPGLRLPAPHESLCRPGVLALDEEPGLPLASVEQAAPQVREQVATTLAAWLIAQVFELGLLHADPHPGNFAYTSRGELVVYDFGCVQPLSVGLLHGYVEGFRALQRGSVEQLEQAFQTLGTRRPSSAPPWALYRQLRNLIGPLLQPGGVWDFAAEPLHEQLMAAQPAVLELLGSLQPSPSTLLVNRTLEGHYWNLLRLGVPLALADRLDEAIGSWQARP